MKHLLPFATAFLLLFSSCGPSTQLSKLTNTPTIQPVEPIATVPPNPEPSSPPIPEVVTEIQNQNVPGVTIDQNGAHIQTGSGVIDIPLNQISERLVFDRENRVFEVKNGLTTIAIYDSSIKTARWGAAERWIEKSEVIKLDRTYNFGVPYVYNPDNYVQVEYGDEQALAEALHLTTLFPPIFSSQSRPIDPSETNHNYIKNRTQLPYPVGVRNKLEEIPFLSHTDIMYGNSCLLVVATLNRNGPVGFITYGLTGDNPEMAAWFIWGWRVGGDGIEAGTIILPQPEFNLNELDDNKYPQRDWSIQIFIDINKNRLGVVDKNGNFDAEVTAAIQTWLTTGNLPDKIKGIPTEQIIFFGIPFGMLAN